MEGYFSTSLSPQWAVMPMEEEEEDDDDDLQFNIYGLFP